MLNVTFGKTRPCEAVTLDDILRHPIWMWAVDEETIEGQDETWQKPVTSTTDVGDDLVHFFPSIAFTVVGTEHYGCGDYDHANRRLFQFRIWRAGRWHDLQDVGDLSSPVVFQAIPTIQGEPGVRFLCRSLDDWKADRSDIDA